jgi:hypothetical protein
MSEYKSLLKEAFDSFDSIIEKSGEDNYKMLVVGVEFDKDGMPTSRGMRCNGSPAVVLAGVTLLIEMLDELEGETLQKIKNLGEMSDKLSSLLSKLGITDPSDSEKLDSLLDSLPDDDKIKRLLKEFKRKFGK